MNHMKNFGGLGFAHAQMSAQPKMTSMAGGQMVFDQQTHQKRQSYSMIPNGPNY